jgi:hypothetical protein
MKKQSRWFCSALLAVTSALLSTIAVAEGGGDLRSAVQNPISSLISLPFKLSYEAGAETGDGTVLNVNPVVPITVGNWNLVNRALIPVGRLDGPIVSEGNPSPAPGGSASGLGDINYSVYFSPVKYDKIIWGLGPSLTIPTASEDQLGSGKWSAGVTGVTLTQPDWGTWGMLGRQLWSFAGDSDRKDVSQLLIQPFANYNLDKGWFLLTDLLITANWEADSNNRWTVPLGGGFGRVFKIGNQPINARLEAYYNVERPTGAPEWVSLFTWQFLFPKK